MVLFSLCLIEFTSKVIWIRLFLCGIFKFISSVSCYSLFKKLFNIPPISFNNFLWEMCPFHLLYLIFGMQFFIIFLLYFNSISFYFYFCNDGTHALLLFIILVIWIFVFLVSLVNSLSILFLFSKQF